MADIKIYGKFKSVTTSGKLLDYDAIDNVPQVIEKPAVAPDESSIPVLNPDGTITYKKLSEVDASLQITGVTITPVS